MWCYIDMSHCEWVVCGYEGFLVVFSLLYVGLFRFVIRINYIPVAAMWCYIDMSHCEWAVCGYEDFLVVFSLLL